MLHYIHGQRRCGATQESKMDKIITKIASQKTEALMEMAVMLYSDMRDEADIVLNAVLDALMARLPEAEFVDFCSKMEG
jgi:hypothetical protein